MIIVLKPEACESDAQRLMHRISERGLLPLHMPGVDRVLIGALGEERLLAGFDVGADPAVESSRQILTPYKLVSRDLQGYDTVVDVGGVSVGADRVVCIAQPRANHGEEELRETAVALRDAGARVLRSPDAAARQSPYATEDAGRLELLRNLGSALGLSTVGEIADTAELDHTVENVDCVLVRSWGTHNSTLLRAVAERGKPVILCRGSGCTADDLLLAAEYVLLGGNPRVILCETGARSSSPVSMAPDLNAIGYLKMRSHLPVLLDPGDAGGPRELMCRLARGAVACGADGVMLPVEPGRTTTGGGGTPSLDRSRFAQLVGELRMVAEAIGRSL